MLRILSAYMLFVSSYSYNIVPTDMKVLKKPLYFFPAQLKNTIPQELYHTFVDYLKQDYDVKINTGEVEKFTPTINNFNKEILLLSHSSGANQLMNIYDKLDENINKKVILIDPLDFKKYSISTSRFTSFFAFPSISKNIDFDQIDQSLKNIFEKDYVEELKNYVFKNKDVYEENNKHKILVLNHKKSDEWRMFPLIPPINALKMEFNSLQNVTIIEKNIDEEFSHFDILDRPWANGINKFLFMKKQSEISDSSYFDQVIPLIQEFYNKT